MERGREIYQQKAKPRHILLCSLSKEETSKVHAMANTKDIWETITLSYEGSKEVKQNMITLLKTQHEMFRIEENESIQLMVIRLQTIINNFRSLGTVISQYDINDKVLRTLPTKWRIQETLLKIQKILKPCSWKNW